MLLLLELLVLYQNAPQTPTLINEEYLQASVAQLQFL
jgi:hypothetical protein